MSGNWFVRRGEEQWGPLTIPEFEELRKGGHVRHDDWVWFSTWNAWERFRDTVSRESITPPPLNNIDEIMIETPDGFKQLRPQEALAYFIDEHLKYMRIDQKERRQSQYVEHLHDFLRNIGKPDGQPWSERRLQDAIERASELLTSFHSACQRNDDSGDPPIDSPERYRVIWKHRDLARAFRDGYTSKEACPMYREGVADIAVEYLRQDLRSPKFEVMLVDALVAMEVYSYGEELKKHPSRYVKRFTFDQIARDMSDFTAYDEAKGNFDKLVWTWMKRNLKRALIRAGFLYAVPIAVAWYAAQRNWEGVAAVAIGFFVIMLGYRALSWVWRKLRGLFQTPMKEPLEKAIELQQKMVLAYEELKGGTSSSPRRVREVLAKVADEGAAWEPGVFSILDAAIGRSPGNWS